MKKNNGITLIALVITIVVLIILASVAITLSLGDNGIFKKASKAKEDTLLAQNEEAVELAKTTNEMDSLTSSRETVTISKSEYDKLVNASSYSEEEKEIGTYIDGSKLYKKTIATKTPATNGWIYDLTSLNIKQIANTYGMIERTIDGYKMPLMYSATTTDMNSIYFNEDYSKMGFYTVFEKYFSQNVWITIEYTKK